MKPVGERSAGNPHAAFDERGRETGHSHRARPRLYSDCPDKRFQALRYVLELKRVSDRLAGCTAFQTISVRRLGVDRSGFIRGTRPSGHVGRGIIEQIRSRNSSAFGAIRGERQLYPGSGLPDPHRDLQQAQPDRGKLAAGQRLCSGGWHRERSASANKPRCAGSAASDWRVASGNWSGPRPAGSCAV